MAERPLPQELLRAKDRALTHLDGGQALRLVGMDRGVVASQGVLLSEAELAQAALVRLLAVVHAEMLLEVKALVKLLAAALVSADEMDAVVVRFRVQNFDGLVPLFRNSVEDCLMQLDVTL